MKSQVIICLMSLLCTTVGAFLVGADTFNKPIDATRWAIITTLCSKNDGLAKVQRSWFDANKFTVRCKDTATYNDVSFNLQNQTQQGQL